MHRVECIVCDLDSTLVDERHNISREDIETLRTLEKRGVKVILATGRHYSFIRSFVDMLGIRGPVCTSSGALIYDFGKEEILQVIEIPRQEVRDLVVCCQLHGYHFVTHTREKMYCTKGNPRIRFMQAYNALQKDARSRAAYQELNGDEGLDADYAQGVYKFSVVNVTGQHPFESFAWAVKRETINVDPSSEHLLDFSAKEASKGQGIIDLSRRLGFRLENTVAFGDNGNDVSMFEVVGTGIAVENAVEELKRIASFITRDCNHSGVSYAIKTHLKLL